MKLTRSERIVDLAAAMLVAGVLMLRVAVPLEEASPVPDWRAYGLMILIGAALLWRRQHPLAVLLVSVGLFIGYYFMGFGAIGGLWPLAPALFNAALYGQHEAAIWVAAFTMAGSQAWRLIFEPEASTLATINDGIGDVTLAAAVILAGSMILSRQRLRSEMAAREAAVTAERDAEARDRLNQERLHIAREVHDVVAHSLAGVGVQARLAEELVEADTSGARTAIRAIIDSTGDAMRQLRATVGGLRGAPSHTAGTLSDLLDSSVGVETDLTTVGDISDLPDPVDAGIRSVVREALTNTVRHSGADRADLRVERTDASVVVEIIDNGAGGTPTPGHGIQGMRERVEGAGGEFSAGPGPNGGFRVWARLPV